MTLPWAPGVTQLWESSSAALRDVRDGGCMENTAFGFVTFVTSASPESAEDAPQSNISCKEWPTNGTGALDVGIPHHTRVWNGVLLSQWCCAQTPAGEWMSLSSGLTETTKLRMWHSHTDLGPV